MKIAFFHELPIKSGSRNAVNEIAQRLITKHHVDLYYTDSEKNNSEKKFFTKTYFYKINPVQWNGNNWKNRLIRDTVELFQLFFLHRKIAEIVRSRKYDLVFVHGSFLTESPFFLLFNNKNKIYYAHAPNYTFVFEDVVGIPKTNRLKYAYEKIIRFVRKRIDIINVRGSDQILSNSHYTKKQIAKVYKRKSSVYYLGVDTSIFKPLKVTKKWDILFVGSKHLVDGLSLYEESKKHLTQNLKIRVLNVEEEWISNKREMSRIYNQSKILLCLAHKEPFGLMALEGMACGIPIIAVNEAGYKETVINNKTGFLIKRDPQELAKKIEILLKDKRKYTRMSMQSKEIARQNWNWKKQTLKFETYFSKLL